jgi:hypothetical protein
VLHSLLQTFTVQVSAQVVQGSGAPRELKRPAQGRSGGNK